MSSRAVDVEDILRPASLITAAPLGDRGLGTGRANKSRAKTDYACTCAPSASDQLKLFASRAPFSPFLAHVYPKILRSAARPGLPAGRGEPFIIEMCM